MRPKTPPPHAAAAAPPPVLQSLPLAPASWAEAHPADEEGEQEEGRSPEGWPLVDEFEECARSVVPEVEEGEGRDLEGWLNSDGKLEEQPAAVTARGNKLNTCSLPRVAGKRRRTAGMVTKYVYGSLPTEMAAKMIQDTGYCGAGPRPRNLVGPDGLMQQAGGRIYRVPPCFVEHPIVTARRREPGPGRNMPCMSRADGFGRGQATSMFALFPSSLSRGVGAPPATLPHLPRARPSGSQAERRS